MALPGGTGFLGARTLRIRLHRCPSPHRCPHEADRMRRRIGQVPSSLEAGTDPTIVGKWIAEARLARKAAEAPPAQGANGRLTKSEIKISLANSKATSPSRLTPSPPTAKRSTTDSPGILNAHRCRDISENSPSRSPLSHNLPRRIPNCSRNSIRGPVDRLDNPSDCQFLLGWTSRPITQLHRGSDNHRIHSPRPHVVLRSLAEHFIEQRGLNTAVEGSRLPGIGLRKDRGALSRSIVRLTKFEVKSLSIVDSTPETAFAHERTLTQGKSCTHGRVPKVLQPCQRLPVRSWRAIEPERSHVPRRDDPPALRFGRRLSSVSRVHQQQTMQGSTANRFGHIHCESCGRESATARLFRSPFGVAVSARRPS